MEQTMEERMREIEKSLGRMEEKLDATLDGLKDHETRLRALEGKDGRRWDALVGQIIGLVAAGVVGYFIGQIIK